MTSLELGAWIAGKVAQLRGVSDFPSTETNAIASYVLGKPVSWLISHPETHIDEIQFVTLEKAFNRLLDGEPLAYITGRRSFYGLELLVDRRVLVPRPETELLVELAIEWLEANTGRNRVADIGTGSGAIAIVLANRFPELQVTAVDISSDALDVARSNAAIHAVQDQIDFIQGDLLECAKKKFDLILANLPYIPTQTLENLPVLNHEPRTALDGGMDGLQMIQKLITISPNYMLQNGCMIFEIQYNQGDAVQEIALKQYPIAKTSIHKDLASLPRVVKIQL